MRLSVPGSTPTVKGDRKRQVRVEVEHERDVFARRALYQKLKGLAADDWGPREPL